MMIFRSVSDYHRSGKCVDIHLVFGQSWSNSGVTWFYSFCIRISAFWQWVPTTWYTTKSINCSTFLFDWITPNQFTQTHTFPPITSLSLAFWSCMFKRLIENNVRDLESLVNYRNKTLRLRYDWFESNFAVIISYEWAKDRGKYV